MLSRKVLVQNVTNLTDARYFAAWGVDYLIYNLDPESKYVVTMDKVLEIREWVSGPKTLVESNAVQFMEGIEGNVLSDSYSSLPLTKEAFFRTTVQEVQKGLPEGHYIIKATEANLSSLKELSEKTSQGVTVYLDITELNASHLDELPNYGLVIQGGEEEKVGFKSFDELDKLYDWLQEESQ